MFVGIRTAHMSHTEEYWTLKGSLVHGQITAAFVIIYIVVGFPWNVLTTITAI